MSTQITKQDDRGLTPAAPPPSEAAARVLFIDLDGTLIRTDLLHEAALVLFKQSPWLLFRAILRLAQGRAAFKRAISEAVSPETRQLPFREEVLEFIVEQRSLGRKVVLATAADSAWARSIADELGVFDGILASDGESNLKGAAKLEAIQAYCREHGCAEFDYLGDSRADLPIWREARGAYLVAPSGRLLRKVHEFAEPAAILGARKSTTRSVLAALRSQQWVKNVLVFVPLVTSHNLFRFPMAMAAAAAFVCFCLCASAVYILNDLADINADRLHTAKRKRPFASGALPISWGLPLAGGLLTLGFALSALALPAAFSAVLAVYFATTCAYSFFVKRIAMLDVLTLAGLYTIRVLGGGTATGIAVSEWLMAFSMFLFVSLAFAKRYAELERILRVNEGTASGRGYHTSDIGIIESMGPASGYIAVLVLALYVNGEQMKSLYRNPWPLWLVCPVLMYWISRVWIKAKRGELPEDPIVFALRDRVSLYLGVIVGVLLVAASVLKT
ncbi:MAG: UbiA family prenyltransferase [Thermoguttaceae bacterium]|jgi:4-hydroxybenzoate polyprenyltransferase